MNEALHKAAQAVLDRWNSPKWDWHKQGPTADLMADLRRELVQQEQAGWIPTSGQLPPIQTRVLCMDDSEHCEVDMWWGPDFNFGWPYWQKLPAAPKQGDKP